MGARETTVACGQWRTENGTESVDDDLPDTGMTEVLPGLGSEHRTCCSDGEAITKPALINASIAFLIVPPIEIMSSMIKQGFVH
jgi:hypothetical protein